MMMALLLLLTRLVLLLLTRLVLLLLLLTLSLVCVWLVKTSGLRSWAWWSTSHAPSSAA